MKAIVTIVAIIAFVMLFATSDNLLVQLLISGASITTLVVCGKWIEKHCLTEEEKNERV